MHKEFFSFFMTCRSQTFAAKMLLNVLEDETIQLNHKLILEMVKINLGFYPGPDEVIDLDFIEYPEDVDEHLFSYSFLSVN